MNVADITMPATATATAAGGGGGGGGGARPPAKLSKVDQKLWLAFDRLASGDPSVLRNATNRELSIAGRLEYGEAALAREAPASRNTIADNRVRLAPLIEGLRELERKRRKDRDAAAKREREEWKEERRTSQEKDRIIEELRSVVAAQQVEMHGLRRRLKAYDKRAVRTDDPSPALGHRRRPARASAPQDPGASPAPR